MREELLYEILRAPLMSEKSTILSSLGKYVFKVRMNTTKAQIKKAVEKIFKVKVLKVNTSRVSGKVKHFRKIRGVQSSYKKALLTLEKGNEIDLSVGVK